MIAMIHTKRYVLPRLFLSVYANSAPKPPRTNPMIGIMIPKMIPEIPNIRGTMDWGPFVSYDGTVT